MRSSLALCNHYHLGRRSSSALCYPLSFSSGHAIELSSLLPIIVSGNEFKQPNHRNFHLRFSWNLSKFGAKIDFSNSRIQWLLFHLPQHLPPPAPMHDVSPPTAALPMMTAPEMKLKTTTAMLTTSTSHHSCCCCSKRQLDLSKSGYSLRFPKERK